MRSSSLEAPAGPLRNRARRYGYQITRQTGSHLRLTSTAKGTEHHVTVPRHKHLRVGTLSAILNDVASYLETARETLVRDLFGP